MDASRAPLQTRWLVAILAIFTFQSCNLSDTITSDRDTKDKTNSFVLENGQKATNVTVEVFPAGGIDKQPSTVARTDSQGQVLLSSLPRGYYSLVVTDTITGQASFVDSVYSDGVNVNLPFDTLRPTGSIKGRIKLQFQDNPKLARVALVGEGHSLSIDNDSGTFVLTGIPAGKHTLVARTDRSGYTSSFRTATVVSNYVADVGTIEFVYSGPPIVTGITGTWDSLGGIVNIKFDAVTSAKVKGYRVYRGMSNNPSTEELLGFVDSGTTSFADSLYINLSWIGTGIDGDTNYVRYRVSAIDKDLSEGAKWNSWSETVRRPIVVAQLPAKWTQIASNLPSGVTRLDTLPGCLIAFGYTEALPPTVWKSIDAGSSWTLLHSKPKPVIPQMSLFKAISYAGSLRWVEAVVSGRGVIDSLRIFKMDANGHVDSSTLAAADDSVHEARLILDSAGLVILEGTLVPYRWGYSNFITTHRFLEGPASTWIHGHWAPWYKTSLVAGKFTDGHTLYTRTTFMTVSVSGKIKIHEDGINGTMLDLDSLTLVAFRSESQASYKSYTSYASYFRPETPDQQHTLQGAPAYLKSIAWFDRKIFLLGRGALWTMTLP